jgi:hypothetical protein
MAREEPFAAGGPPPDSQAVGASLPSGVRFGGSRPGFAFKCKTEDPSPEPEVAEPVIVDGNSAASQAHDQERRNYSSFATRHAEELYRERMRELYTTWAEWNREYFGGNLVEPHLAFGRTAQRCLGHCARVTDYRARVQITLNAGLVFGSNRDWVVRPWPAEGTRRFIVDLLLRFSVRQYVLEVRGAEEKSYRGFGPLFVEEANRVGKKLGLPPVVMQYQAGKGGEVRGCNGWPHAVRGRSYYGADITDELYALAVGAEAGAEPPAAMSQGLLELVLHLLDGGQAEALRRMVAGQLERLKALPAEALLVRRLVEKGERDVDGSKLDKVAIDPAWLTWGNGTVRKMAAAILEFRALGEVGMLADVLEMTGCRDGRILRHLREPMTHTSNCWVLRRLMGAGG